jgi:hypothetical protein
MPIAPLYLAPSRAEIRITFSREWEEFRVYPSETRDRNVGAFCSDALEALETAEFIAAREGRIIAISSPARSRIEKARRDRQVARLEAAL